MATYFRRCGRRYLPWAVFLAALALVLAGCGAGPGQPDGAADGEVVTAFIGDLTAESTASGALSSRREATLSVSAPGRVTAVLVRVGDSVQAGDALLQLDTGDLELDVINAEQTLRLRQAGLADLLAPPAAADVAAAEAAVASAQASLDEQQAGPLAEEVAISEAGVRASTASLSSAAADLANVRDSIKESQILAAQATLLSAQLNRDPIQEVNEEHPNAENHQALLDANQAVADAQAQLDDLLAGPDVSAAQSAVAAADARVEGSQADLDQVLAGASAANLASATQQLAQAQATLATLVDGPTVAEIEVAEAEIEQAALSLADAQARLTAATINAPFAGVITSVSVEVGEIASGDVLSLADLADLEVILEVDEVDVGRLAVGQAARLTLETWPDRQLESEILAIAPGATVLPGSALVTYAVHLGLADTDLPVRLGMTANANLVTANRTGVLLVPNRAVNVDRQAGTYSVILLQGDARQEVQVTIGLRDSQHTQILDGLEAGDRLLVSNGAPVRNLMQGPPGSQ